MWIQLCSSLGSTPQEPLHHLFAAFAAISLSHVHITGFFLVASSRFLQDYLATLQKLETDVQSH